MRTGPFRVPGSDRLLTPWDVPQEREARLKHLRRATAEQVREQLITVGIIVAAVWYLQIELSSMLIVLGVAFLGMPLLQRVWELRTMSRPDYQPPGTLDDLRFQAWLGQARPVVTWAAIGLICGVYGWTILQGSGHLLAGPDGQTLLEAGALARPLVLEQGQWWRLATCVVLHANLLHLLFNSLALRQLGSVLEPAVGSVRFGAYLVLAGLAGSAASLLLSHASMSVGASGAVCGVLGLLVALSYTGHVPQYVQNNTRMMILALLALGWLGREFIDNAAHAGGLAAGMAIGYWHFRKFLTHNDSPTPAKP